jgi:tRNA G18 (ribose-2'-O)-methylase SpoU
VAEGRLVVSRLVDAGHRIESLLLNDASCRALESSIARLPPDVPVYICRTDEFAAITGFNLHRGCLALAERPGEWSVESVLEKRDLLLVLEDVTDADNVGSAFRNAAAFDAGVVLNPACCDPLYRKAIRTSMGSVLRTPYARMHEWPGELETVRRAGFTIVALTPHGFAGDLAACDRSRRRVALLAGNEWAGLTPAARSLADVSVRIPISGDVDSLNLATATGIALYYFTNPLVIP